jgi:alpha-L-fucosidase 2
MDSQIVRALFDATLAAQKILANDPKFAEDLAAARKQLAPDQIGKWGQLQEWLEDKDNQSDNHRHVSPLWTLFPGDQLGNALHPSDPKMLAAAAVLLKSRGDGSTGWSYAWRICLLARLGEGDAAFRQFSDLVAKRTLSNMLDLCGTTQFQIDGNFGAAAGLAEMLIQSHTHPKDKPDVWQVDLLPALPRAWPKGSVTGLCARGGFTVDFSWDAGKVTAVTIHSAMGNPVRLNAGGKSLDLATQPGQSYSLNAQLQPVKN